MSAATAQGVKLTASITNNQLTTVDFYRSDPSGSYLRSADCLEKTFTQFPSPLLIIAAGYPDR